jgi:hypothetical protein
MEWNAMSKFINSLRAGVQTQAEATMMTDTGEIVHNCAKHVEHAEWGPGATLAEEHAAPDESGNIAWYDIMFEHGLERQVPTADLNILVAETHKHAAKKIKENVNAGGETAVIDLGSNAKSVKDAANQTKANVATPGQVAGAKEGGEKAIVKQGVKEAAMSDKEKKLAAMGHPKDKVTHKDVLIGRGVLAKEELTLEDYSLEEIQDFMMSEDFEQLDELSKKTLKSYVKGAKADAKSNRADYEYTRTWDKDQAKGYVKQAQKREAGIAKANTRLANEAVEELDELSKKTLGSYVKSAADRATHNRRMAVTSWERADRETDDNEKEKFNNFGQSQFKKYKNRITGVGRAVDRLTKEDLDFTEAVDETIEYKTVSIQVNEADKNYDGYFKAAMKAHGVKHPGELKSTEDKKKFFNKVDAGFKAKNEDVFIEAWMRSDVEERIAAHTKAGNKISDQKHTTKAGQGHHSFVVTEPSGKRTRHIFHGNSRKLETMSAAPKSKLAHEAGEDEDDK